MEAGPGSGADVVSVVVPTRNSARTLEACLASIRAQTYPGIELVVVDNGSTDGTKEIAGRLADIVLDAGPERSAQRNRGAAAARGRYLLIVDSDMALDSGVVQACVEVAEASNASAVVIPERSVGNGFWAAAKALERSCYVGDETIEAARFFTREAFERHGGYDESMTGPEDWDLPARMRAGGEVVGRVDAEIVHLEGDLRLRDTIAKKFYYGQQMGVYVRRHPELARRQLRLVRPAFLRHRRQLVRRPFLTMGMIVMKVAEFGAGGLGLILARRSRRPSSASE